MFERAREEMKQNKNGNKAATEAVAGKRSGPSFHATFSVQKGKMRILFSATATSKSCTLAPNVAPTQYARTRPHPYRLWRKYTEMEKVRICILPRLSNNENLRA